MEIQVTEAHGTLCYINGANGTLFYIKESSHEGRMLHLLHREDGPAIIDRTWGCSWYLDNKLLSFDEWKKEVRKYYETEEDYLLMLLKL